MISCIYYIATNIKYERSCTYENIYKYVIIWIENTSKTLNVY